MEAPAAKAAEVGIITVQPTAQSLMAELPGRTSAFMMADIRPQANGIVEKRLFTEGAQVKAGQVLYQLDDRSATAAVNSAQAAVAKAKATAQTARSNAARNAELVKIDAISRQVYDDSQAAVAQTASDVAVAQAALDNAKVNLQYTRITSPISGRVSTSSVTPGALVTANQTAPLTTVVQLDPMYVDFTQSSTEMLQLQRDLAAGRFQKVDGDQIPVRIRLDDGTQYPHTAKLKFAGVIVNATTGTVTLRAQVPNPDGMLMPNMYVQALLPTAVAPDALLVPQQSVTRDLTGRASVMVVGQDDKIEKRPLEIDRAIGNQWLVGSGLKAGERVVVDGFQRVKVGDKVHPTVVDLKAKADKPRSPGRAPGESAAPAAPAASAPAVAK
ncbi:membrane fusion protein (multidrug efflux system) [Comamonas odontotermitis]|uniref:Membrane fusion protein (Multidrug efflux system) n=2 Tax=Comamonas odontotermitis TaxID=379895 RepID=A0ABR6RK15_9BURK|nr:efflux RND transporter periplasmic adaptor subunit [Comamonas odontotermitis]MBB6579530.1 membrane fusion protein (multidrug efflux system) [Comamonas odontotermitis]